MTTSSLAKRRIVNLLLGAIGTLTILTAPAARATTIDPLIWEQLVIDSDFVGIVECETAGGIVARYRVTESWKGAPPGTHFTVRMAVNYWGPQFPETLVGERYLMTAFKSFAPIRMISTTSGSPVPLWWRNIPADYRLPLWQGRVSLPLKKTEQPLGELGSHHQDLESFKKAASELLVLDAEGRELRLLKAISKKYLFGHLDREPPKDPAEAAGFQRLKNSAPEILKSSSAREFCLKLLALARDDKDDRSSTFEVFAQGGGEITLKVVLEQTPASSRDERFTRTVEYIERRLGRPAKTEPEPAEAVPSEHRLMELRKVLARGQEAEGFGEAFEMLTRFDPGPVAEFLVKWTNPNKQWQDTDFGYVIGSYFAWRCGKDRERHLRTLLAAQDAFIRVAGAVYLCFENREAGMAQLEELTKLPGDPGVWAALNLVSRGAKNAVPRALEVLSTAGPRGHMSGVPHQNLQTRLIVLLSNSAAFSGLPQPKPPLDEPPYNADYNADASDVQKYQQALYRYYIDWWRKNESKVKLTDPWLRTLEQQKVD